jgi:hypothetical protein
MNFAPFCWSNFDSKFQTERRVFCGAPFVFSALLFLVASSACVGSHASPEPVASASPEGIAVETDSLVSTAAAQPTPLTEEQKKKLSAEFDQALKVELRALNHQMQAEYKALQSSQRIREREWKAREKKERRDFFKSTDSGPDKTSWMADRKKRYEELKKDFRLELERVNQEQVDRRKRAFEDQKQRREKFDLAVKSGVRPEAQLWHPTREAPSIEPEVSPSPAAQ